MLAVNATDVRNNFGGYIDQIVRSKPLFIKRSRDHIMGISLEMAKELVSDVEFEMVQYTEGDGSVTLSLEGFDLVVNGEDIEVALDTMSRDLREYALEYYENIDFWGSDKQRRAQFKSILRILLVADDQELRKSFQCRIGRS